MKTSTEQTRIVIDDNLLADSRHLHQALTELYLGEHQNYQIYVHERHLLRLEKVMDEIILKYGLRPVNFDYCLMRSLCGEEGVRRNSKDESIALQFLRNA